MSTRGLKKVVVLETIPIVINTTGGPQKKESHLTATAFLMPKEMLGNMMRKPMHITCIISLRNSPI